MYNETVFRDGVGFFFPKTQCICNVIIIQSALFFQQIEEKHAKRMCHKYRSKVMKMNSKKEGEQQKYIEEKIEELHQPVAKSAEVLCREILRYEGKTVKLLLKEKSSICCSGCKIYQTPCHKITKNCISIGH